MSHQSTYRVLGMTCGHCEQAVAAELRKLAGVTDVRVDLAGGDVTVTSDDILDEAAVHSAIEEAGYEPAAGS